MFDVAGSIEKIEDPRLANQMLEKVNDFNVKIGLKLAGYVVAFCLLPSDVVHSLLQATGVVAALYFLGKE